MTLRLNDKEYNALIKVAEKVGVPKEVYIRMLITGTTPKEKPTADFYNMTRELNAIGNSIMIMTALEILKEISSINNGLILTKNAVDNGVSRASLSQLCKEGKISRIAIGQYVLSEDLNDEMLSLSIRSNLIVFSHETALFLNGISERTPFEHTVTIPSSKTLSRSISAQCKIYYIKDELHDLGKVQLKTPMGNRVWAYDMDRTICDTYLYIVIICIMICTVL